MAMTLGIFAGTGMDARAAGNWEFVSVSPTEETLNAFIAANNFVDYYDGAFLNRDWVEIEALMDSYDSVYIIGKDGTGELYYICQGTSERTGFMNTEKYAELKSRSWYILKRNSSSSSGSTTPINVPWYYEKITLGDYTEGTLYDAVGQHDLANASIGEGLAEGNDVQNMSVCIVDSCKSGNDYFFFCYLKDNLGRVDFMGSGIAESKISYKQLEEYTESINIYILKPKNTSSSDSYTSPHTHSYSWVTVQEANAGQDGIEEYRCSCGDVQERCIIPANMVFVKGLYGEIKNAPQNGTATFDSGRLYTISDYVIKKLAERTDVTTVITFEYQNQAYKMTIPAGADFTGLLADEDYFYGYFFFANAVGATIEAI